MWRLSVHATPDGRTPPGVRELKPREAVERRLDEWSHPSRGA